MAIGENARIYGTKRSSFYVARCISHCHTSPEAEVFVVAQIKSDCQSALEKSNSTFAANIRQIEWGAWKKKEFSSGRLKSLCSNVGGKDTRDYFLEIELTLETYMITGRDN